MAALRLDLAYDGTEFRGWARQPGQRTVEGVLQDALHRILREAPELSVAGRTDAGVHARGQVASFDAADDVDPARIQRAVNGILAPEVVVRRAFRTPDWFDARRSASAREYCYRISLAPVPDPFAARYTWHLPVRLSLGRIRAAARQLLGEHDFASFCRTPQRGVSTVRRLERLSVARRGDLLEITARANAFLHQMVRSLVGTMTAVGEGKLDPEEMPEILAARDRSAAGPVAPPHGLTLERVLYARRGGPVP
jgi:tRNA pseudouridine38-40 synthase